MTKAERSYKVKVVAELLLIFVLITMGILRGSDKEETGGGMVL